MNRLIHSDREKLNRWDKAALKELSPAQRRYVDSMQWLGYKISKVRLSGSQNDLEIALVRTTVLLTDSETDNPRPIGMSEELREHIVTKKGVVSKGRKQFKWRQDT